MGKYQYIKPLAETSLNEILASYEELVVSYDETDLSICLRNEKFRTALCALLNKIDDVHEGR